MSRFDTSVPGISTDPKSGLSWTRGFILPDRVPLAEAKKAIKKLNAEKFGGFSDWRIAEVEERVAIIDFTRCSPAMDVEAFDAPGYGWEWTNTATKDENGKPSSGYVWVVGFNGGLVHGGHRGDLAFVRAVRGPSPAGQ